VLTSIKHHHTKRISSPYALLIALLLIGLLTGCAGLKPKAEKPTVKVSRVIPLEINLDQQRFRFVLDIDNPNSFDLPLSGVDFIARFNTTTVASGKSEHRLVIPANGSAELSLDVTAGIDQLLTSLKSLLKSTDYTVGYAIDGRIRVDNWRAPIPFSLNGNVDLNDKLRLNSGS